MTKTTEAATTNIAKTAIFIAKADLLASQFKWEELSAVIEGIYKLHGAIAPDIADDLWHIGQHPLQIEMANQTEAEKTRALIEDEIIRDKANEQENGKSNNNLEACYPNANDFVLMSWRKAGLDLLNDSYGVDLRHGWSDQQEMLWSKNLMVKHLIIHIKMITEEISRRNTQKIDNELRLKNATQLAINLAIYGNGSEGETNHR